MRESKTKEKKGMEERQAHIDVGKCVAHFTKPQNKTLKLT